MVEDVTVIANDGEGEDDDMVFDQCDVCGGSSHIVDFGACPKCVGMQGGAALVAEQSVVIGPVHVKASSASQGASSSSVSSTVIDADLHRSCELCLGSGSVSGFGPCPVCREQGDKRGLQQSLGVDPKVAADITAEEHQRCSHTGTKARDEVHVIASDRQLAEAIAARERDLQSRLAFDRAMAELLSAQETDKARIQALTEQLDEVAKQPSYGGSDAWRRLATLDEDVSDETKVRAFFERRQQGRQTLQIEWCNRVENLRLDAFKAERGNRATLLFHGTPERNVGNILAAGLLMEFCGGCGGIFGAIDPQTSLGYAQKAGDSWFFMAVCIYDLPLAGGAPQAGAAYSVAQDDAVAVLWLLKVSAAA